MDIRHHPSEQLLFDHTAGHLDEGQSLAMATHLEHCPSCRAAAHALKQLAGGALNDIAPVAMAADAFERTLARLDASSPTPKPREKRSDPALPNSAQRYPLASWKWVAPGVSMRPIMLPKASATRAFLLKSAKGTNMLQHTHSGLEMTCVLTGSFSHEGGEFRAGDFDFGDDSVDHKPLVGSDEDCICLVAMTGQLKLKGLLGKVMQPFIRL